MASLEIEFSNNSVEQFPVHEDTLELSRGCSFLTEYHLKVPSAVALLEWNSRIGIPCDVWALVLTGIVQCGICTLFRIEKAHMEHYKVVGACQRPGSVG